MFSPTCPVSKLDSTFNYPLVLSLMDIHGHAYRRKEESFTVNESYCHWIGTPKLEKLTHMNVYRSEFVLNGSMLASNYISNSYTLQLFAVEFSSSQLIPL